MINWLKKIIRTESDEAASSQVSVDIAIKPRRHSTAEKRFNDPAVSSYSLGVLAQEQGNSVAAIAHFNQSILHEPNPADAHYQLGNIYADQGSSSIAEQHYRQTITLKPDFFKAHFNLGNILAGHGRSIQAADCYRQVLLYQPDFVDAHISLGNVLHDQGQFDGAIASYQRAIALSPDFAEVYSNVGNIYAAQGQLDMAISSLQRAIFLKPDYAEAHSNLAGALQLSGKYRDALDSYERAMTLNSGLVSARNNYLYAQQYVIEISPAALYAEHARFAEIFEAPLRSHWPEHANERSKNKRLRVGYVSGDFRRHAVAIFMEPILACHDRDEIEIFCYFNSVQHDDISDRIQAIADHWRSCADLSDEQFVTCILNDGIDILIDLSGHTAGNRLLVFAAKPAPVQITYLGYPGSTGLHAMDYRITDGYADDHGNEQYYAEKLIRMPHSMWCYSPRADMPDISPLPALKNGFLTFGSFNNFNKLDQQCVELWAQLLRAMPTARLVMVTIPEGAIRMQFAQRFAMLGIESKRIDFHGKLLGNEFHRMFQQVDLTLDPLNVNGATTSCESLWMGVPFITVAGTRFLSRAGLSILSAAGMQNFAARSVEHFIEIAVAISSDIPQLAQMRISMRAQLATSPLMDKTRFARDLEKIYRGVWMQWCNARHD